MRLRLPRLPGLGALAELPGLVVPAPLQRRLARVLHDLATLVESAGQDAAGQDAAGQHAVEPAPHLLAARLRDQLGREPSREELHLLLRMVDGFQSALCLSDGELARVRAALASYAAGLGRDAARA